MSNFKKYPKIKQFKDIFRKVRSNHDFKGYEADEITPIYEHTSPYPTLKFTGTVKLHGTNAAIGWDSDDLMWLQSRNRILTIQRDNAGFAHFVHSNIECINTELLFSDCIVYGEWCGSSIQKGVAINKLEKMFVIFAIRDLKADKWITREYFQETDEDMLENLNDINIYFINQFPTYEIEIDFNAPELIQNKLVTLTKAVGDECPVAKHFGESGTGEGIVWHCTDENYSTSSLWFKVKDERHSTSKVKKLGTIDVEKVNSIREFINMTVTSNRLNQGIEYFKEMKILLEKNKTGEFIKWVKNDIIDEDFDTLSSSGLTLKDVGSSISKRASQFYLKYVSECYE